MTGKILVLLIVLAALIGGGAMYYLQVYYYYTGPVVETEGDAVRLTAIETGEMAPVAYKNYRWIDGESSPIKYRACFDAQLSRDALAKTYTDYAETGEKAEPLTAPHWFDCFDAGKIGTALEEGRATAFLGQKNIEYGIDRVVAITDDGRGYVWHQINRCGAIVFDGRPAPEDCPTPPEGYR